MWWVLVVLFGGAYVVLRVAGETRSERWVLAAIAFRVHAARDQCRDRQAAPLTRS
ncbi:MAG: hypothetical protein M3N47_14375 [Chloroflexota bacterium]|nr:hypothetical protein [Chloroflexota bacterium]